MNAGTRADHHPFCLTEVWEVVRDARGRAVGHHLTFELLLGDGRRLRTRVSRPADKTTYGQRLWATILREQLDVSEDAFWACVKDKRLPDRGREDGLDQAATLPAGLVYQLIHVARLPEDEVMRLTLDEANVAMATHWSRPPS